VHWFPCGTFYFHTTKIKQPKMMMSRDFGLSSSSFAFEEKKSRGDDKPPSSSLPSTLEEKKTLKMTTSRKVHYHLL